MTQDFFCDSLKKLNVFFTKITVLRTLELQEKPPAIPQPSRKNNKLYKNEFFE
jgi:hypothetical protein